MANDDLIIRAAIRDEMSGGLREISRELGAMAAQAATAAGAAEGTAAALSRLAAIFEVAATRTLALTSGAAKLSQRMLEAGASAKRLALGAGQASSALVPLSAGVAAVNSGVAALTGNLNRLQAGLIQTQATTRRLSGGMRELEAGTAKALVPAPRYIEIFAREIGTAEAGVGRFRRAWDLAGGALTSARSKVSDMAAQLHRLRGGVTVAAAATAALGGGGIIAGLKYAGGLEQAEVAFTTLFKSQEKAAAYMGELKQLSQDTPFQLPQLAKGAQRLMAMGFQADAAKEALIAAGNAASSMALGAEGIDRITLAFGQMMAAGRIQGDEMRQLNEAGINGYQMLADAYGKSVAEIKKMGEQGALDSARAIPVLIEGINSTVGGAMEAQSKTLFGQFEKLKEVVNIGLGDALAPAMPQIKQFIAEITTAIGPLVPVFAQIGIAMLPAITAIANALTPLAPMIGTFATLLGGVLAQVLVALAPALPPIATALVELLQAIMPITPLLVDFAAGIAAILSNPTVDKWILGIAAALVVLNLALSASPWMLLAIAVVALIGHFGGVKGAAEAVGNAIMTAGRWVWDMVTKFTPLGAVIKGVTDQFGGLSGTAKAAWEAIKGVAEWVFQLWLKFSPLGIAITAIKDHFGSWSGVVTGVKDAVMGVVEWIQKALEKWQEFNSKVSSVAGGVTGGVKSAVGWLNPFGDTKTSKAAGRSAGGAWAASLGRTIGMHAALAGPGIRVSNALVGGGGFGAGSGDHQAGRALDLVGSGLPGYAARLKEIGGWSQMHGSGAGRHLHAVYPSGDTQQSMIRAVAGAARGRGGGSTTINLPAGAITVYANSEIDLENGVRRGIEAYLRDRGERG